MLLIFIAVFEDILHAQKPTMTICILKAYDDHTFMWNISIVNMMNYICGYSARTSV